MTSLPSVTIGIPTYNRLAFLRQTIDSALSQTYRNLQIIVSDNHSNDGTAAYVSSIRDPRLVFIQQTSNIGMIGNWNACLQSAAGDFFLLLSDDDCLEPTAIQKLVDAFLHAHQPENVAFAYCRTWEINREGLKQRIDPLPPAYESALNFALAYFSGLRKMHPCSTLLRTTDLRQIGGYTQGSVVLAVDAIVWTRILIKRGTIAAAPEPLSSYRIHPGSETSSNHIDIWRADIATLADLWSAPFSSASPALQSEFRRSTMHYSTWELAALINQSAKSFGQRLQALKIYYHCRNEFKSGVGALNLVGGLAKLFVPELVKRPVRALLLRAEQR